MQNISGFGLIVNLIASNTFPLGLTITEFADDSDPLDLPSVQIADSAMGLNGDLITWSTANPILASLNVIPGSEADIGLAILLEANRVSRGKIGARDTITMVLNYPSGNFVTLIGGIITDGMPSSAVSSEGRLNTKNYNFAFESRIGA